MKLEELLTKLHRSAEISAMESFPGDAAWKRDLAHRLRLALDALERIAQPLYEYSGPNCETKIKVQDDQLIASGVLATIREGQKNDSMKED